MFVSCAKLVSVLLVHLRMGNVNDDNFFLPLTDSFENVAGYVQGLLNKAIADTNAGITAVGVAVGAVDPDDGCVDERRVDNEVTAREFDEDSEPVRLF